MKVLLFARLREALGIEGLTQPGDMSGASVGELKAWISQEHPGELAEALADPNVICAVNQRVVSADHILSSDDEVAFYPPVTGG